MRWYASGASSAGTRAPGFQAERLRRRHRARQLVAYRLAPFGREPRDVVELRGRVDDHAMAVRDLHRDRYALDASTQPRSSAQRSTTDWRTPIVLVSANTRSRRPGAASVSPSTDSVLAGRPSS